MTAGPVFELRAPLPQRVPWCARVQVLQVGLSRELEIRTLPEGASKPIETMFLREFEELSALDHPGFLPVVAEGTMKGKRTYGVPLRTAPTLAAQVKDEFFTLEARAAALRDVAGALAALHLRGITLGGLDPRVILWDGHGYRAFFAHHRPLHRGWPERFGKVTLPADLDKGRRDLFLWACLAEWLLSFGEAPADAAAAPLEERQPVLARGFSGVVDSCRLLDADGLPSNAAELVAVLQTDAANLRVEGDRADRGGGDSAADEVRSSVLELRKQDRVPQAAEAGVGASAGGQAASAEGERVTLVSFGGEDLTIADAMGGSPPPRGEPTHASEAAPAADVAPTTDEGPTAADDATPTAAVPSAVDEVPPSAAEARPSPEAPPTTTAAASGGAGTLILVAGVSFALGIAAGPLLAPAPTFAPPSRSSTPATAALPGGVSPTPAATPSPPSPSPQAAPAAEDPAPDPGERLPTALAPTQQERYLRNPTIRRLVERGPVPREDFAKVYGWVRELALSKSLPPTLSSWERVHVIQKPLRSDPARALAELERFLAELRALLGVRPGATSPSG